jgi:hypothetical protein
VSIGHGSALIKGTTKEMPKVKTWTVVRNVIDPAKGDNGLMRFVVDAPTAAAAAKAADDLAAPIRKAAMRRLGIKLDTGVKRGKKKKSGKGASDDDA